MKAISLWQPWASLIDLKLKTYETRSWGTRYRGDLLICSAKKSSKEQERIYKQIQNSFDYDIVHWYESFGELAFGKAIAIVTLTDCIQMTEDFITQQSPIEIACGDWQVGRYAWKLENVRSVVNVPVKGKQGFFEVDWQAITGGDVNA